MGKFVLGLICGIVISSGIAWAVVQKYETSALNAKSEVGYGKSGADIIRLKVASDGTLQIQ